MRANPRNTRLDGWIDWYGCWTDEWKDCEAINEDIVVKGARR